RWPHGRKLDFDPLGRAKLLDELKVTAEKAQPFELPEPVEQAGEVALSLARGAYSYAAEDSPARKPLSEARAALHGVLDEMRSKKAARNAAIEDPQTDDFATWVKAEAGRYLAADPELEALARRIAEATIVTADAVRLGEVGPFLTLANGLAPAGASPG